MLNALTNLARAIVPRQKANPAGEGNVHAGPYNLLSGGWLPSEWGKYWNFWQMDYDPLPRPSCSIVEACVWAYIRAIAQLPGFHKRELENGGTELIHTSALSRLLRTPNAYETPSDFLVHLIRSLLLAGNSYWIAQRNDRNEVVALHWTDPRTCNAREVRVRNQPFSEVFYEIGDNPLVQFEELVGVRSGRLYVPARDVFHVKLATPRHPLVGETWLAALTTEITQRAVINESVTTAATTGRPTGVLTTDLILTTAQVDELRERWRKQSSDMAQGGAPILTGGFKFQPVSLSAEDSKIIDQLKLDDRAIAAVFGVPLILVGIETAGGAKSAEAVMSEWLAAGLGWLINHIEVAFDAFIGLNEVAAGREWTEFDTRVLLRSLYKERIEGLVRGVQGGLYAPNEARALEGYPSVPAGDEPRLQSQVVPLSFALVPPTAPTAPAAPAAPAVTDESTDDDEPADDEQDEEDARALAVIKIGRRLEAIRDASRQRAA